MENSSGSEETNKNRGDFKKAALIIGGMILLAILIEGTYFAYIKYFKNSKSTKNIATPTASSEERVFDYKPLASSRPQTLSTSSNVILVSKLDEFKKIFAGPEHNYGVTASSFITTVYTGTVVSVGEYTSDNGTSGINIRIKNDKGDEVSILFNQQDLTATNVFIVTGSSETKATYKDIITGDNISITMLTNLLSASEVEETDIRIFH